MASRDRPALRRGRLVRRLAGAGADGLLVTCRENVRYLSGFTGQDSALLLWPGGATLITDGRYLEQAEAETRGLRVLARQRDMMAFVGRTARREGIHRLGVEAKALTLAQAESLKKALGRVEMVSTRGLVEELRRVKDRGEVALIRRAIRIAEEAFRQTLARLRPGLTERDAARILEHAMMDLGAEGPAFPTIVAAGDRTSLPHATPTRRRIRRGEAVLFDWGARLDGYHSDLTRVVFVDRIPPLFGRLYEICLGAQRRGIARIRPGRLASGVDRGVRTFLKAHRHNKFFPHAPGHGLGLAIHESPNLGRLGREVLMPGMVCTVEPGLYLPGRGGVRVEDDVLVTRRGHEVLTSLPKSPGELLLSAS